MDEKTIKKRDGSVEKYDFNKIKKALDSAFLAVDNIDCPEEILEIVKEVTKNCESVEKIQDTIESSLMMNGHYKVAKAYILYREKHKNIRDTAQKRWEFIENFVKSSNTANATIDDNANVNNHNIAVLNAEIHKEDNMLTNMYIWEKKMKRLYPDFNIKQMREDFKTIMYPHDASSQVLMPYCMAVSMYPYITDGLKKLGGKSAVPKSIESFCGIYVNLIFALASEVKGAVATPEVLMYFDYFARKEWGDDYYLNLDKMATGECSKNPRTIRKQIHQYFQQIVYSINQVSSSRGAQCPFTNFSFFDKYFFDGMFEDFMFPDGTKPIWESTNFVQQEFLHWFNQERLKCINTFPVCSYACQIENGEFKDKDTFKFICREYSEGNSFFTYISDSVDSLSSCCRLQNAVSENTFNFTNGQMGIITGSKNVITLNLNRIIQDFRNSYSVECCGKDGIQSRSFFQSMWTASSTKKDFQEYLISILERVYMYHKAYNSLLHWAYDNNLFNAYKAKFIDLNKQYLTIGINGLNQAAEFVGIKCNDNEDYKEFCKLIFKTIKEQNILHKTKTETYNCEQVPAESASIKLYNRDKADGYWVPEDTNLYASYIFKPNDPEISVLNKIKLHSKEFAADELDGGSAAHINLAEHLSEEQYEKILSYAAKVGCKYFTFNVPNCECKDCGFIAKQPFDKCPKCNSSNVSLWDRIIGYLVEIRNWSKGRQEEQKKRIYNKNI